MSRRYGGIHSKSADFVGRELGRIVADQVWMGVRGYFDGSGPSRVKHQDESVSALTGTCRLTRTSQGKGKSAFLLALTPYKTLHTVKLTVLHGAP